MAILRAADRTSVAEAAKKHRISEQTIYGWRKQLGDQAQHVAAAVGRDPYRASQYGQMNRQAHSLRWAPELRRPWRSRKRPTRWAMRPATALSSALVGALTHRSDSEPSERSTYTP